MQSSQLTIIFFRGVTQPPTSKNIGSPWLKHKNWMRSPPLKSSHFHIFPPSHLPWLKQPHLGQKEEIESASFTRHTLASGFQPVKVKQGSASPGRKWGNGGNGDANWGLKHGDFRSLEVWISIKNMLCFWSTTWWFGGWVKFFLSEPSGAWFGMIEHDWTSLLLKEIETTEQQISEIRWFSLC